jgi:2-dehydropantoate 2-reductase
VLRGDIHFSCLAAVLPHSALRGKQSKLTVTHYPQSRERKTLDMRIVVVGAGPIGGNIGGRLARDDQDVTFVDVDPEHVEAIRRAGLQVEVPDGNFNVRAPIVFPNEIEGNFNLAFIAVRTNYTRSAVDSILPYLAENGLLVSLQNGINLPLLEAAVGMDRTIGAALRLRSVRPAPGHIRTTWRGHLHIGHTHGRTTPALETVHSLLAAVIPTEITDNILGVLWSKLSYTCFGLFGSLTDDSLKNICASETNRRLCVEFFSEVVAVGKAAGARFIPLKEYEPLAFHPEQPYTTRLETLKNMWNDWKSDDRRGPIRQLKQRVKTEVDQTFGHVISEGERLNVDTPLCRSIAAIIHEIEDGKRPLQLQNYAELAKGIG